MTPDDSTVTATVVASNPAQFAAQLDLGDLTRVISTASSPESASASILRKRPSIVIIDLGLPEEQAFEILRETAAGAPEVGLAVVAPLPLDVTDVARALHSGADAVVTSASVQRTGAEAFAAAARHESWLPSAEIRDMLAAEGAPDDLTSAERESRLRSLVIGLIPATGAVTALISLLFRRYLGQVGVRPVDLDIDPTTRIADVFFAISILVGVFGPLMFIGSWIDLLRDKTERTFARWLSEHIRTLRFVLTVLVFGAAVALAAISQVLFALFVGPTVAALLLAKVFDLDDDLPDVFRITRLAPARAAAATVAAFVLLIGTLSYEVLVRGPEFGHDGEIGWIAPSILGFNAEPVRTTVVDDGTVREMLYLGGNADLYVLVDPCDNDRVDLVSVGSTKITVIDRVTCPG